MSGAPYERALPGCCVVEHAVLSKRANSHDDAQLSALLSRCHRSPLAACCLGRCRGGAAFCWLVARCAASRQRLCRPKARQRRPTADDTAGRAVSGGHQQLACRTLRIGVTCCFGLYFALADPLMKAWRQRGHQSVPGT
jgi:hypothetical protein